MWTLIASIGLSLLQALPSIVKDVEELFSKTPKSGPAKLQAVTDLVNAAAEAAGIADAAQAKAIDALAKDATDALVTFYNAIGAFTHSK